MLGPGTELHNFNKLYNTVQARIGTGLDLQCFPNRMAFWQGTVAVKEVLCVFSSLPPDNLHLKVLATLMLHWSLSAINCCIAVNLFIHAWDRNGRSCMTLYDLILRKGLGQCHIWQSSKCQTLSAMYEFWCLYSRYTCTSCMLPCWLDKLQVAPDVSKINYTWHYN